MAIKYCDIEETELENDNGKYVPGVVATCQECGVTTESFGTATASIKRCMVLMREACRCYDAQDAYFTCDELDD